MVVRITAKHCETCRHYKVCNPHSDEACNDYESRYVLFQVVERHDESNSTEIENPFDGVKR